MRPDIEEIEGRVLATTPGYVQSCRVFGGRNPKNGKPVGSRHRWSGCKWGEGRCVYCGRTLEEVTELSRSVVQ